jgi:hypothetical protein
MTIFDLLNLQEQLEALGEILDASPEVGNISTVKAEWRALHDYFIEGKKLFPSRELAEWRVR